MGRGNPCHDDEIFLKRRTGVEEGDYQVLTDAYGRRLSDRRPCSLEYNYITICHDGIVVEVMRGKTCLSAVCPAVPIGFPAAMLQPDVYL